MSLNIDEAGDTPPGPADSAFTPPDRASRTRASQGIQKSMALDDLRDSHALIELLRTKVASDIEHSLSKQLVDGTYDRVIDRLERRGDVSKLVDGIASQRIKSVITTLSAVAGVLAVAGFTVVPSVIANLAERKAELAVKSYLTDEFAKEKNSFIDLEKSIRTAANEATSDVRKQVTEELDRFRREHRKISDTAIEELKNVSAQYALAAKENSNRASDLARRGLEELDKASRELKQDIGRENLNTKKAIEETRQAARANLQEYEEQITQRLTSLGKSLDSKTLPAAVGADTASRASTLADDPQSAARIAAAITAIASRDYRRDLPGAARKLIETGGPAYAGQLLQPILIRPEWFDAANRMGGVKELFRINADDRLMAYAHATELLINAVLAEDVELYTYACDRLNENPASKVTTNDLVNFAKATFEDRDDELPTLYEALTGLTGRGYANVLRLAKKGGLDKVKLRDCEKKVLDALSSTNLVDRPTDYPLAWMVAKSLTTEPAFDRPRIKRALDRVVRIVVSDSRPEEDPWELRKLVADFNASPITTTQENN